MLLYHCRSSQEGGWVDWHSGVNFDTGYHSLLPVSSKKSTLEALVADHMSCFIEFLQFHCFVFFLLIKCKQGTANKDASVFSFQSLYGMQRLSTRSRPTSTSPRCRQSSPLTSPSTSRLVLLQECSWRTWASRTSSERSSAVSKRSDRNKRRAAWTKYMTRTWTRSVKKAQLHIALHSQKLSVFNFFFFSLDGNASCWQFNFPKKQPVRSAQHDVILMTQSTAVSCCHRRRLKHFLTTAEAEILIEYTRWIQQRGRLITSQVYLNNQEA